jgi:signal transduction histidine kinase
MTPEWLVLLRPDGIVDAALNGAPATWLGHQLANAAEAPVEVREAAAELLRVHSQSTYVHRRVVQAPRAKVEIVLVEAVPLRKAHTRTGDLLVRVLEVFASQAKSSSIELSVRQENDVPAVFPLDGEKIAWAVTTLVGNALRYAQVPNQKHKEPRVEVRLSWDAERNELVLAVADNGPGMTEQRAKWLFDRDPTTGATAGLALLMVRDVVAAHRGTIRVETGVGKGTTFVMRLPR